jgi:hypothetical protein
MRKLWKPNDGINALVDLRDRHAVAKRRLGNQGDIGDPIMAYCVFDPAMTPARSCPAAMSRWPVTWRRQLELELA